MVTLSYNIQYITSYTFFLWWVIENVKNVMYIVNI